MKSRLLGRIGGLGSVAVVCACAALSAGAPAASAETVNVPCASITGSGSSLQSIAQEAVWNKAWSSSWNLTLPSTLAGENALKCTEMSTVEYKPTGSGKGEAEWGSKTGTLLPAESFNKEKLDGFVGTDIAPEGPSTTKTSQLGLIDEAGNTNVTAIPVAQSAISVIVSLPEGCTPSAGVAHVKNMALWEVWDTKTATFNEFIEGVTLSGSSCGNSPLLEAREVGSGTTAGFKRYLDDLNSTVYGACTATAAESESASCWPGVKPDETGNETGGELAEKVFTTEGTTGYADVSDAIKKGFAKPGEFVSHTSGGKTFYSAILEVPNGGAELGKEGRVVSPLGGSEESNCSGAEYPEPTEVGPNIDWSQAKQGNATSGRAGVYPICTLTFDLAWERYKSIEWVNPKTSSKEPYSEGQYYTAFNYLRLVVTEGQTGTALAELEKEHFYGVPAKVVTEDEKGVNMKNIYWEASGK